MLLEIKKRGRICSS